MTNDLPLYQCHKTVRAVKILEVLRERKTYHHDGGNDHEHVSDEPRLVYSDGLGRFFEIPVSAAYLAKHNPQPGGYYVRYEDGYESFSPAEAFEDGYTKVTELPAGFDWAALQRLRRASA